MTMTPDSLLGIVGTAAVTAFSFLRMRRAEHEIDDVRVALEDADADPLTGAPIPDSTVAPRPVVGADDGGDAVSVVGRVLG